MSVAADDSARRAANGLTALAVLGSRCSAQSPLGAARWQQMPCGLKIIFTLFPTCRAGPATAEGERDGGISTGICCYAGALKACISNSNYH